MHGVGIGPLGRGLGALIVWPSCFLENTPQMTEKQVRWKKRRRMHLSCHPVTAAVNVMIARRMRPDGGTRRGAPGERAWEKQGEEVAGSPARPPRVTSDEEEYHTGHPPLATKKCILHNEEKNRSSCFI